jgi:hypothetical protein
VRVLILLMLACVSIAIGELSAFAQTKPLITTLRQEHPSSVLFIGKSFFSHNDDLPEFVGALQRAADPARSLRTTSVTISGSGLDWHDVESYFRPNRLGKYSFDGQNNVKFNNFEKPFDIAIMMDCSQCPIHPSLKSVFVESARKNAGIVRAHGASPIFFMSWAYADRPEMTERLAEAYTLVGNQNDALVVPAGLAFARARLRRPDLNLYAPDRRHPSVAGTYLAACTTFAALMGRSPVGNPYHAGLKTPIAEFLQQIAWDTAQDYYGQK